MITLVIAVLVAIVFWIIGFICGGDSMGDLPISPYWDYENKAQEIARLEAENYLLRQEGRMLSFYPPSMANSHVFYQAGYSRGESDAAMRHEERKIRFKTMEEQEQMAHKLTKAMRPLKDLLEEIKE